MSMPNMNPGAGAMQGAMMGSVQSMPGGAMVRRGEPLETYEREAQLRKINQRLQEKREPRLQKEEIISARLYTGPMYTKYNAVLRASGIVDLFDGSRTCWIIAGCA